ncbi:MAG: FAD-dependent oxidoreductase [Gemmatimonadetes bacterium]|nr:FAD-dependent oxidoreductase [Gemmatimonadota bacterium]
MSVAVLGGGIAGLTAAYRLARAGQRVTLYEATDRLGGLGTDFEYEGHRLEKFYHVILDSDTHLLGLLDELGLTPSIRWAETHMGFIVRGKAYAFNTPGDLLRFGALRFHDRIRTGLGALYITKICREGTPLDDELACEWLPRVFGRRVYATLWEPLLTAKFGELRHLVPAYWIWNALNREKNGSQEVKGYVRGGYGVIADRLAAAIEVNGGEIRLSCPVHAVEQRAGGARIWTGSGEHDHDAVVSTLPLPLLHKIAMNGLAERVPLPDLAYQGVVNAVLICREPLDRYYWTAVVDSGFPFQGIVETTHVLDPAWIGGRHLVYLMNYCSADGPTYGLADETVKRHAITSLRWLYPRLGRDHVEAAFVFRAPYVEPVWTRGYLKQRPASRIAGAPVYLATTAQAYPMVTSWNTSVKLADDAVAALLENRRASIPQPARRVTVS